MWQRPHTWSEENVEATQNLHKYEKPKQMSARLSRAEIEFSIYVVLQQAVWRQNRHKDSAD